MIVVGINSVYHESAASIVVDGKILAAAEEERFNRYKHGKPARADNPHILPVQSLEFCLKTANIKPEDIDLIAYSFDPKIFDKYAHIKPTLVSEGGLGSVEGDAKFRNCLDKVKTALGEVLGAEAAEKLVWISHHIAHAASAFFPSGYQESAILVIDGIAEKASSILAFDDGHGIKVKKEILYPHSLGFLWEQIAVHLGFSEYDAAKLMGLAAYGRPEMMDKALSQFAQVTDTGFNIEETIFDWDDISTQLELFLGKHRKESDPIEDRHADITRSLQEFTNSAVMVLCQELYALYPSENLCLAGGVALNCVTNWLIKEKSPFKNVFIPPAAHDAGTAVGAALQVYHTHLNHTVSRTAQLNPYLGPEFSEAEILAAIEEAGLTAIRSADTPILAADAIAEGKVVGWFQNRMEFGPRALGNRSLLADPRHTTTRELLNRKVKHREDFRPFAPSILAEKASEWFEIGRWSESFKYMLFTCPVRAEKREKIPAVIHVDGTARVQVVDRELNPNYYQLIERFEDITGIPVVLNTSFNDSEPIVCSVKDAISTFKGTAIDVLVIQDFFIERKI
ncbi:MAG: carbamoyltransferase [Tolypothrix carrinoi HA7290-LM1]|jgi:carbamoyltransferase|nr:carbamoyltransferase [Tolypothrix carrinoi HA7290-LM1]